MTSPSAATPLVGVHPAQASVVASSTGVTDVTFDVYLTTATTSPVTVDFAVVQDRPGDLGTSTFGTLPSGTVTVAAGQTAQTFTGAVPADALGSAPTATLDVALSSPTSA